MEKRLYREKSMDRVSSPEQLDGYIRVVTPGIWLVLGAVLVLLVSVFFWVVTGTVEVTVEVRGYSDGSSVYCYLDEDEISAVSEGMKAYITNDNGNVTFVSENPESYRDIAEFLGDEGMAHALHVVEGDWKYKVVISTENAQKGRRNVTIVTERMNPISYLIGNSSEFSYEIKNYYA